eukprot:scaffold3449_cov339-Prasinococcus_capsulatus_cf.AAC.3
MFVDPWSVPPPPTDPLPYMGAVGALTEWHLPYPTLRCAALRSAACERTHARTNDAGGSCARHATTPRRPSPPGAAGRARGSSPLPAVRRTGPCRLARDGRGRRHQLSVPVAARAASDLRPTNPAHARARTLHKGGRRYGQARQLEERAAACAASASAPCFTMAERRAGQVLVPAGRPNTHR